MNEISIESSLSNLFTVAVRYIVFKFCFLSFSSRGLALWVRGDASFNEIQNLREPPLGLGLLLDRIPRRRGIPASELPARVDNRKSESSTSRYFRNPRKEEA